MRPICWLHISDIHLRSDKKWQQDVVLKAMCRTIEEQRKSGTVADFILVTGDIAFSGKSKEYELAGSFFDDLQTASGVPRERIFCIAGNHDIDRCRQKMCFRGTRSELKSAEEVDTFLEGGENFNTLLQRQKNFRDFQQSYFEGQERTQTTDGLGYVSRLEISEIRLAIVGLDSAWLAEGGPDDHGKLLIGERQAINAIELVQAGEVPPNIVVGMAHHPLHLLQDYDRQPVQNLIEDGLHFFHCGHLHVPEAHITGAGASKCLTMVAGASFQTRHDSNAYYVVKLDLLHTTREVRGFQYNPIKGTFSLGAFNDYQFEITATGTHDVGELAKAMESYCPSLAPRAHYLSALILGQKAEFLIPLPNGYTFGSADVFTTLPDSELKQKTTEFMAFKNILDVLYARESLSDILVRHGDSIRKYSEVLTVSCDNDSSLRVRLENYITDCRLLVGEIPQIAFSHTLDLLNELANAGEWVSLREKAERLLSFGDVMVVNEAKRMLALALANSDELQGKERAIEHYQSLVESDAVIFTDIGNLATLLMDVGRTADASSTILEGIKTLPEKSNYFSVIGQQIVEATGNRDLRRQIENAIRG
ncbi:MAG: metallophosphoesterase [Candidatus Poribacteria bacterium]|nr:metallophosphoesterase [Candidatus Poribacteria bacterium]MDE0504041.1 metallophosphoesterase [Candidatus Poribacteria bacterium]